MSFSGSGLTEIAHAVRSTDLLFTPANGLTVTLVPFDTGQSCRIPRLGRPVYLHAWGIIDLSTAVLDTSTELAIANRNDATLLASEVIAASHGPGNGNGSTVHVFHRLEPDTPGDEYFLYAGSANGAQVNVSAGNAHAQLHLLAFC